MPFLKNILNIKKLPETIKATLVFGIASFATSGINYITTPVFTRLLTTSEYGIVSIYNSWFAIVQVFLSLTLIYPGVLNVGLYEHSGNRWKYLSTMLGIITTVSCVFIFGYLLFKRQINALMELPSSLVLLCLLMSMIHPATVLWTTKQRYEYKYKMAFVITVGSAVLSQCVSIAAVMALRNKGWNLAVVRLWSAAVVNIIVAVLLYVYIMQQGKQFYNKALWKNTFFVAVPLIPHYLSGILLNASDKIMIGRMIGKDQAGIYSLAAVLSSIGILFWRALLVSFSPFVNVKLGEKNYSEIRRVIKPLWVFTGVMCIIAALLAPEIIRILGTKDYADGIYVVPPIAAGIFTYALYDAFAAVPFFYKKSIFIMLASVTAAVSNLIMNYFGIIWYGYVAAGYTTMLAHVILIIMHYWNTKRVIQEGVYDSKFAFALLCIVIGGCLACNLLYGGMPAIRYSIGGVLIIALIVKRKVLFKALADMKV